MKHVENKQEIQIKKEVMIKLDFLRRTASVLFISGSILFVDCANFKPSSPTADIIYPAAPFLTRRAGVGNETDKG